MMMPPEPLALYSLEIEVEFAGPMPNGRLNKAAPEVSAAHREAVEAAQSVLRAHGFMICITGHGSRRIGTHLKGQTP